MRLASVLVHDADGYHYERTALVPDDWTPAQIPAAMIDAAHADVDPDDDWLSPLIAEQGEDSLALWSVQVCDGAVHRPVHPDGTFGDGDADASAR